MALAIITGSSGLVGSENVKFLTDKGFEVIGIDNNERKFFFGEDGDTTKIKNKNLRYSKFYRHFNIDITNYILLEKIFKKYKNRIELIIHAAAQPSHDWAKNNVIRDFTINAKGTLNMLELTKIYANSSKFIYVSTNKVYGDNPNKLKFFENKKRWELKKSENFFNGITEDMSIDKCTHSFFGVSKLYADLLSQEYANNYGMNIACFRAGCITGPNHSGAKLHGFLSYLVKSCIKKNMYHIIGYKGKQVRDNIHSHDLTRAFWEYYKKPIKQAVFNIGGGRFSNCSIIEAIDYIKEKTSINVRLNYNKNPRTGDHKWYISNNDKFFKNYPNFKLKYNLKNILDELIDNETKNF
jgi:CDP-paratose 2-epimerase